LQRFVAEFFDTRDAITAVETLDGRVVGGASLSAKLLAHAVDSSAKPDGPALHYSTGASFTLGSAAYNPGSFLHAGAMGNAASTSSKDRHPIGDDPFLVDPSQATPEPFATIPTGATSDTTYRYKTPPGETSFQGMRHSDGPRESGGYAYHETPPHLTAMGRRMTEPGALQSIVNRCDISARSRQGHGLGSSYSPHDKQAIPEQNRVFPERIVSGELWYLRAGVFSEFGQVSTLARL